MLSLTESATLNSSFQMEKVIEFSPEALKAPFFLRIAAMCVDYMLLMAVPVLWLLFSKFLGDGANGAPSLTVWLIVLIVWLLDFLLLPLFRGQTLGKMLCGTTIVSTDGTPVRLGGLLLRNVVGYLLTLATLGLGFLISAVNRSGRSLHDFVGGTIVVHGRKRQA
jgi:uncharacterized RDD family membrane protein YckC